MTDVVASLECMLALQEQPRNACTEEEEEEEKGEEEEEDVNVHVVPNQLIYYNDMNKQQIEIFPQGIVASSSTPVQLNDDTQRQKRSRKNLFQRVSVFLAGVMGIRSMRIDDVEIRTTATTELTSQDESNITGNWQISAESDTDMPYPNGQILPTPNLRIFNFSELTNATGNFDTLLGEGRYGKVYFKLGGYYWVDQDPYYNEKIFLVYEFMQNGSLEQHLFRTGSTVQPLPWDIRLKILIGAARGLAFLHALETPVICIEFKASNILLDESFNSKLSDFSFAELDSSWEYVPTLLRYPVAEIYPPEYVFTGLRAYDTNRPHRQHNLVVWGKLYLDNNKRKLARVIDRRLEGRYPEEDALRIAHLARHCLEDKPGTRPSMKQVVETLEGISASHGNTE
ncbi:hypothetical protein RHGRI_028564 [Rhododendron griersonianum]|uniref:Protein kinase domain-containing protein n=1 Tax=Rhododendron griersonianum TaxID=479676 RepID=A0AAV6IGY9_9ERIC|nr:hypothetical protein RHGRI_028564 [Rhododendron griersonianum]